MLRKLSVISHLMFSTMRPRLGLDSLLVRPLPHQSVREIMPKKKQMRIADIKHAQLISANPAKRASPITLLTSKGGFSASWSSPLKVEREAAHVLLHLLHILPRFGASIEYVTITIRTDHGLEQAPLTALALRPQAIVLLFFLSELLHPVHDDGRRLLIP